jgi:hypothetical protein
LLIVKKPDVIQKNELYFCNQDSNVIQNQLSKSKHRLKSFVLQACVIYQDLSGNKFATVFLAISRISAGVHERLHRPAKQNFLSDVLILITDFV